MPIEEAGQGRADKYRVVSIRLRAAEYESFSEQAAALGLSTNLALRIAARRIAGFLEIDPAVRAGLERALLAIGDISRQVGRLHAAYVESGAVDVGALSIQRVAFGEEFAALDASMRTILNISRRRSDGLQLLADAMALEARRIKASQGDADG
jgi:type IV secretion system T-DNA border endonuclease VirD1